MTFASVFPKRPDRTKTRNWGIVRSMAIASVIVVGCWVAFSGCRGDNAADDGSPSAAATDSGDQTGSAAAPETDAQPEAAPADPRGTASAEPLAEALRGVIVEMLEEAAADLPPEQVATETEARYQEGVETVREFYPEFLEATTPTSAEPARMRIEAARRALARAIRDVPIVTWLLEKHDAGQLDPDRTELLAQLLQGHFRRLTSTAGRLTELQRSQLAAIEKTLFAGPNAGQLIRVVSEAQHRRDALKKIALGMHSFHEVYQAFPGADRMSKDQPPGLSWRVHLLPFVGEKSLHEQFKLDEPWDSAHNRQLVEKMPEVYRTPGVSQPGMTAIHVFVGEGTPFGGPQPTSMASIKDGTSNTLACVMAGPETATEWTRPGGIEFDPQAGMAVLGTPQLPKRVPVAFLNGSTMFFPPEMPADKFSRFVMHQDGVRLSRLKVWDGGRAARQPLWPFGDRRKPMGAAEKMEHLGAALHEFHDVFRAFPSATTDQLGRSGLSWRVHILRFVDQQELYDQFKIDEPWDSPHNIKLVEKMPDIYGSPGVPENKTVFHVFVGEGTPFGQERGPRMSDIKDGTSNTIMAVKGTPETAVEWTKPGGLTFDPANAFQGLAQVSGGYPVLMMDGRVALLSAQTSPQNMAGLVTHNGAEADKPVLKPWK